MKPTHRIKVKERGRLKLWDKADGDKCIIIKSGLRGDKSKIRTAKGASFEVPTDWLEPLNPYGPVLCVCPWSMLIRGCECNAILVDRANMLK